MISLKHSIRELEECEGLFRASLGCYLAAIQEIGSHTLEIVPEVGARHRDAFDRLASELPGEPTTGMLERSSANLGQAIEAYASEARGAHQEQERHVREILTTLTEAAQLLNVRNDSHSRQLRVFTGQLEKAAQLDDLGEIQRRLRGNVTELKTCIEQMSADNRASVADLKKEVADYQKRLTLAEQLAYVDPLTGVGNRREGERQLKQRIEAQTSFCLIMAEMNRFRWINEQYGHQCGDQALKLFCQRLKGELRPTEVVCRWGGDEFLVLMECGLSDAMRRTFQLGPRLRGRYTLTFEGKETQVDVGASLGVAEYVKGESLEQLFLRAYQALHRGLSVETPG